MNRYKYLIAMLLLVGGSLVAQEITAKREKRKNLTVKEWNSEGKDKREWLDHVTTYNADGLKIEEIEYATYGLKERTTYEYDAQSKCIKEVAYNDKNRVYRIRKFEYDDQGRKKIQYNYNPNGKLYSTKRFEYTEQQ